MNKILTAVALVLVVQCTTNDNVNRQATLQDERAFVMWYNKPSGDWLEALPVGNGNMGAMVFGGVDSERIQFNENTLWTGQPHDYSHEDAASYLDTLRQMLYDGRQQEAEDLATDHFMSVPIRQQAYQPLGDVHIRFKDHHDYSGYHRELDLERGLASTSYTIGDTEYVRTVFASYPDQVVVIHITSIAPGAVSFQSDFSTPHSERDEWADVYTKAVDENTFALNGQLKGVFSQMKSAMSFEARLQVQTDGGTYKVDEAGINVSGANSATLVLAAATSFVSFQDISADPAQRAAETLQNIANVPYNELKNRHVNDHYSLFRRNTIDLGGGHLGHLPVNERILAYKDNPDPAVIALLYQYGRYLMIASSRPGSQPANLSGVWNKELNPPWDSKYTININLEMNYWLAERTGLSETHEPLFDALQDLSVSGARVAQVHYDLPGWVTHHNFDLWRGSAPINFSNHGIWPVGGAWLTQHLWWRYLHTGDEEFLRNRAYPILKEASQFFVHYLIDDPVFDNGWLVSGPSNSPEHGGLVMGPAMDHQIIRYLFRSTAQAAHILGVDEVFKNTLMAKAARVAPDQIGSYEQLQEWLYKENPDNRHRHVSHLWAVHPGNEITPETPDLFEAAQVSLDFRGDEGTGWARAWKVNFWARFLDAERANRILNGVVYPADDDNAGVYPNLFGAHPPFQIDGNFGITAGVFEMLMQTHRPYPIVNLDEEFPESYRIHLLPALPEAWKSGSISGLRAKGGFIVDISWINGNLENTTLESKLGRLAVVHYDGRSLEVRRDGQPVEVESPEPGVIVFSTSPGAVYTLH